MRERWVFAGGESAIVGSSGIRRRAARRRGSGRPTSRMHKRQEADRSRENARITGALGYTSIS
jgi:hypothetical protein